MFFSDFELKPKRLLTAGLLMLASASAWSQGNHLFAETRAILDPHDYSFSELPTTQATHFMTASAALVSARSKDIVLEVEPGVLFAAHLRDFKVNPDGISVWTGAISDSDQPSAEELVDNQVILVRHGNNITGSISIGDKLYMVSPLGDGNHAIIKTDSDKFPAYVDDGIEDHSAHDHDTKTVSSDNHDSEDQHNEATSQNALIKIRVMTATTNDSRNREADMPGLIALSIARANESFRISNVNIEFENAGILNLNYNEQGKTNAELLWEMNNRSSALGGPLQAYRDAQLADLAVLITSDWKSTCGIAYQNATKTTASSAVAWSCSAANRTYAHETGHNIGASHEGGYQQMSQTPRWRTLMKEDCSGGCPRIANFSNPDVYHNNLPTGTANNNNARTLNQRAQNVANFYPPMTNWVEVGQINGQELPERQFFEIQIKNNASNQKIYSFDQLVSGRGAYDWPWEIADAINRYFPDKIARAGEMDSNGNINVIKGSSYRNKLWLYNTWSPGHQLLITRYTYADSLGSKWASKAVLNGGEATPGTQKHAVLRNTQTNQVVARVVLPITSDNTSVFAWPAALAKMINEATPVTMRAGEMQADGTLHWINGSSYRNQVWVPVGESGHLTVTIETHNASGKLID